uniref:Uncharacterized protein n=1 Tax=Cacopsylla melanoneura TaxID=428564 RepID=A0A8D8PZ30_9HEMI
MTRGPLTQLCPGETIVIRTPMILFHPLTSIPKNLVPSMTAVLASTLVCSQIAAFLMIRTLADHQVWVQCLFQLHWFCQNHQVYFVIKRGSLARSVLLGDRQVFSVIQSLLVQKMRGQPRLNTI